MKSKILLQFRFRITYVAISLCLFILTLNNMIWLLFATPYMIYVYKNHKTLMPYVALVFVIYSFSLIYQNSISLEISAQYDIEVIKVFNEEGNTKFTGEIDGVLVNTYLSDRTEVEPGDLYTIKGELHKPINNTIPNQFNYKNYLKSKKIYYTLHVDEIDKVDREFNLNYIPYRISNYINEKIPLSSSYVKTFILADKNDFDQELIMSINMLGISHLFAVSGLHVGILVLALKFTLEKAKVKVKVVEFIVIFILCLYMLITAFSPSIVRASLMYIFLVLNKKWRINLSSTDVLSFIFITLLIVNPYFYFNTGFILSFLVTFSLLLSVNILKKFRQIILLFIVGLISFITTFPIILNLNYQINLLSLLFNVIFILYMSLIILPLSYITFIFPIFDSLNYVFIKMFNTLIFIFSKIKIGVLYGSFTNIVEVMIFYIIIISLFYKYERNRLFSRHFLLAFLFVIFILFSSSFNVKKRVVFLDVKGDSTFISDSFNRCNILIDTGEPDDYDSVISYIKSINVRELDFLFISHWHSDHYGEMDDILSMVSVDNLVTPSNISDFEGRLIQCGSIDIYLYELSSDNSNENNNSLFISVFIADRHYLFTGDSELERELEFIEKYSVDIDYLKVAHHGSITSSYAGFLDSITPEEAFIMVHRYNHNNHPDFYVMNRYEERNIKVYRTDLLGTIEVEYFFNYERKKYNKP